MIAVPHEWQDSRLGHGEQVCIHCCATNRELAVIGNLSHCPERAVKEAGSPLETHTAHLLRSIKDPAAPIFTFGDLVRYSDGPTAIGVIISDHSSGFHIDHVLGGWVWHATASLRPADPEDHALWLRKRRTRPTGLHHLPLGKGEFLNELREVNSARYDTWTAGQDPGAMFDALELGGEVGELLNIVKKLEREERGWRGSRVDPSELANECADVLICLDKLARRFDIDLIAATVAKFNATSEKFHFPHALGDRSEPTT